MFEGIRRMLGLSKDAPPAVTWQELSEDQAYPPAINRKIRTQLAFRATVDAGKTEDAPTGRRQYRPEDSRNEALRRELFLRRDIIAAMSSKMDCSDHQAAFFAINDELTRVGGHRGSAGAVKMMRSR